MISNTKSSIESFFYHSKFQTSRDALLVGATITTVALSIIFVEPLALGVAVIPLAIYMYSRYKRINHIQSHQKNLPSPNPIPQNPSRRPSPAQVLVDNSSSVLSQPVPYKSMAQSVLEDELDFGNLEIDPYEATVILCEECLKNEMFLENSVSANCQSIKENLLKICHHFHLKVENIEGSFVTFNQMENHTFGDIKPIKNQLFSCFLALDNVNESAKDDIIENKQGLFEAIQQLLHIIRAINPSAPQPIQESEVVQSPEVIKSYETAVVLIDIYLEIDFREIYTNEEWSKLEERLREVGGLFGLEFYEEIKNKYDDELGIDIPEEYIESKRGTTSDNFTGINHIEGWLKNSLLALRYIKTSGDKEIISSQKNNFLFYLEQLKNVVYDSCPAIRQQE